MKFSEDFDEFEKQFKGTDQWYKMELENELSEAESN